MDAMMMMMGGCKPPDPRRRRGEGKGGVSQRAADYVGSIEIRRRHFSLEMNE